MSAPDSWADDRLPLPKDAYGADLGVTVVIATLSRPDELTKCLECLARQSTRPLEVIVVDTSRDDESRQVVTRYRGVSYLRNDSGIGSLPLSRQIGLSAARGEIVAYLDDDAYADPDWLEKLASEYGEGVGGVGGQARNGQPGELAVRPEGVGRLDRWGRVIGNFASVTPAPVEVDHLIGCNMSFRKEALLQAGGIPDWPAGVSSLREDLWLSLRVRGAGWRLIYAPLAGVHHVGAPQVVGRRFDTRYVLAGARNHVFVLFAHFGPACILPWRALIAVWLDAAVVSGRSVAGAAARVGATLLGSLVGLRRAVRFRSDR